MSDERTQTPSSDHDLLIELRDAMFGDEEKAILGVYQMNKEMYQAWSSIIWLGKVIGVVAVFLGAVGTAWMAFGTWIKHLITGK